MSKPWRDKQTLRDLYVEQGLPTRAVADELGCAKATIERWLEKCDIEIRSRGYLSRDQPWQDPVLLSELYIGQELTVGQIAERWDCSPTTVNNWREEHGIERISLWERRAPHEDLLDPVVMNQLYVEKDMSLSQIAERYDCSNAPVRNALMRHGIGISEPHYTGEGEDHPGWKGGYQKFRGESWTEQRQKAIERDGGSCQLCGDTKADVGQELDVHHIIPFSYYGVENHRVANRTDNLVTLCRSCHHRAEKFTPLMPTM